MTRKQITHGKDVPGAMRFEVVHKPAVSRSEWKRKRRNLRPLRVPDFYITETVSDFEIVDAFEALLREEPTEQVCLLLDIYGGHLDACGIFEETTGGRVH